MTVGTATLEDLAARLGEELLLRGWKLATAESCTGGWIAETVTAIAGSSDWFDRGYVTYSNAAKHDLLGVAAMTLERYGAVSAEAVTEMAAGALARSGADCALAVTGIAGPGGATPGKPVGLVWFGWATRAGGVTSGSQVFAGDRRAVRAQAVCYALTGLLDLLS
ncbi:MAG: nicotinamide-nucleotide amidohydrolase family protein [Gammaproteobacteria bacterium]|nr:nicotinamide-nucleotide amidohydrolase family protein [Gammaproteobacteria bacterium]MBI5616490.1 nicotinamide-nucleotide amidohydrolase family protein [Gammaproteobacteria bacterium]